MAVRERQVGPCALVLDTLEVTVVDMKKEQVIKVS
jgi:hypothetical protein